MGVWAQLPKNAVIDLVWFDIDNLTKIRDFFLQIIHFQTKTASLKKKQ